ncbi:MAG: histidine kinase [Chromatiales bacterium]|nr:histidine kinase [Chromatiales bacterium]
MRRQLLEKVITTQEDERRRIARELHDSTSQNLTSSLLACGSWKRTALNVPPQSKATDLRLVASQTLDEVHDLSMRLRPRVLDDLGLAAALERLVSRMAGALQNPCGCASFN